MREILIYFAAILKNTYL